MSMESKVDLITYKCTVKDEDDAEYRVEKTYDSNRDLVSTKVEKVVRTKLKSLNPYKYPEKFQEISFAASVAVEATDKKLRLRK